MTPGKSEDGDILEFYRGTPADNRSCPITRTYLEMRYGQPSGGGKIDCRAGDYIDLKYSFAFFSWLQEERNREDIPPDIDVFQRSGVSGQDVQDVRLQKWHLYVAWAALRKFREEEMGEHPRSTWRSIRCPELLLWMLEASKSEKTEALFCELMGLAKKRAAGESCRAGENAWRNRAKEEIARAVSRGRAKKEGT